jgi:hypothetical protein
MKPSKTKARFISDRLSELDSWMAAKDSLGLEAPHRQHSVLRSEDVPAHSNELNSFCIRVC